MSQDVLDLCSGFPQHDFDAGEELLAQGPGTGRLFVLIRGSVEIRRDGVAVATVSQPGSFLGEIAALLGRGHTASVVALEPTGAHVVHDAARAVVERPALLLAVARVLALRLDAMTGYLADLSRTYGGEDGHLAVVHTVLGELMTIRPLSVEPGSERDVPDY